MTDIDKRAVYRKAAEVIARDGKTEGELTEHGDSDRCLMDTSLAVCALGACARAQYELYGVLPERLPVHEGGGSSAYRDYNFAVLTEPPTKPGQLPRPPEWRPVYRVNDTPGMSAEDVALILKRHAEEGEIDG